ncbi:hypothetical protein [Fodinibius sp. Rm-B-1B1-1]|uniref:hypothetical protein n=1 Tax=Fodinibius alkaliphilus TaxID=3140241 RepID=UPI00315A3836
MSGPEFVVAIVAICCATGLIKKWMDSRNNTSSLTKNELDNLQKELHQYQKEMKKRVQNLEAIVAEEDGDNDEKSGYQQIEASSTEGNLTNDLQQKEQVSS